MRRLRHVDGVIATRLALPEQTAEALSIPSTPDCCPLVARRRPSRSGALMRCAPSAPAPWRRPARADPAWLGGNRGQPRVAAPPVEGERLGGDRVRTSPHPRPRCRVNPSAPASASGAASSATAFRVSNGIPGRMEGSAASKVPATSRHATRARRAARARHACRARVYSNPRSHCRNERPLRAIRAGRCP